MWPAPAYACSVQAIGPRRYEAHVELPRFGVAERNTYAYSLIDEPVDDASYRAAVIDDYGPDGLFLDQVIVSKLIDGRLWRFSTNQQPLGLRSFGADGWNEYVLSGELAPQLAERFGVREETVRAALRAIGRE